MSPPGSSRAASEPGLALVGFMGAGKSTLAAALAPALGLPLVDLDAAIEARSGRSIPQIFAEDGEPAFRALEAQVLALTLAQGPAVLACGGGAPCAAGAMEALRGWGLVVYLAAPLGVLGARAGAGSGRPLWDEAVAARYAARLPRYQQAHLTLDATCPVPELVQAVLHARRQRWAS